MSSQVSDLSLKKISIIGGTLLVIVGVSNFLQKDIYNKIDHLVQDHKRTWTEVENIKRNNFDKRIDMNAQHEFHERQKLQWQIDQLTKQVGLLEYGASSKEVDPSLRTENP